MPTTVRPTGISHLSASVETICVDPARIDEVWPHVRGFILDAIAKCGDWTENDIRSELDQANCLLWIRTDGSALCGAGVTQLIEARHGKTCNVMVYGGPCDDWPSAFAPIERYARDEGCVAIRIQGREGWKRVFRDYDLAWITLEMRLA